MKKICFITTIYGTYHAFLKSFSLFLLNSGEYDVSLICDPRKVVKEDIPKAVHYYPVKIDRGIHCTGIIESIRAIKAILRENNFDIVQYATPNASFYASIAARAVKVQNRLYCQWGIRYMGFSGIKRSIFKTIEKITCANSTCIEAESFNIRNYAISEHLYPDSKSSVIWNGSASGVNLNKFNINQRDEWRSVVRHEFGMGEIDVVFSFVGRLTADKGINELLQAFCDLSELYSNVVLMLIGPIDNEKSLDSKLYDFAKNSPKVKFTGNVPDVEKYFAATDVFVAPSYREGFGLVVVEAAAMGLPAIVSDVPGQIDAIIPNRTGLTCRVKDSVSLKEAMSKMLECKEVRQQMSDEAAKFARDNYDQEKLFEHLKAHRDELISNP